MPRLLPGLLLCAVAVGLAGLLPSRARAQWGRSTYGSFGRYGRDFGSSYYTYPYSSGYYYTPRYSSYYRRPGYGYSGFYYSPGYTASYYSPAGYGFPFRNYPLYGWPGYSNVYYAPGTIFVYP